MFKAQSRLFKLFYCQNSLLDKFKPTLTSAAFKRTFALAGKILTGLLLTPKCLRAPIYRANNQIGVLWSLLVLDICLMYTSCYPSLINCGFSKYDKVRQSVLSVPHKIFSSFLFFIFVSKCFYLQVKIRIFSYFLCTNAFILLL